MDRKLVSDSLVYRYDPAASPDGLRGSEGTFSLCTFLYVDALARAGRLPQARYTFEKMQTHANHVGLFAEEIGPSGEQLGNFPRRSRICRSSWRPPPSTRHSTPRAGADPWSRMHVRQDRHG